MANRNPQDSTLRNVRAAVKRLDKLEAFVKELKLLKVGQRLKALEKKVAK